MSLRYCINVRACTAFDNVYNPLPGGLNPFVGSYEPLPITIEPGRTVAKECTAFGNDILEGGLVGVEAVFQVEARDRFGNRRLTGGDVFEVMVYPPSRDVNFTKFVMEDGPGEYVGQFMSRVAGVHNVLITLKPRDVDSPIDAQGSIKGSPFNPNFRLMDGLLRPEASRLITSYGAEITAFPQATVGQDLEVIIQAYTCPSQVECIAKRSGRDRFSVRITEPGAGPDGVDLDLLVKDHSYPEFYEWPNMVSGRYSFLIEGTKEFQRAGTYLVRLGLRFGNLKPPDCRGRSETLDSDNLPMSPPGEHQGMHR